MSPNPRSFPCWIKREAPPNHNRPRKIKAISSEATPSSLKTSGPPNFQYYKNQLFRISPVPSPKHTPSQNRSVTIGIMPPPASSKTAPTTTTAGPAGGAGWSHTPTTGVLLWLAVSLPLVAWDTGYMLLRPHTMPGGSLHWPLWAPYKLYGEVDHMYGFKQWRLRNGFAAGQSVMNAVESLLYLAYLWVWYRHGREGWVVSGGRSSRKAVSGKAGGVAVVLGFSAAVMTVSKTVLYWLNEYFSDFDNIGHNKLWDLVFLWIIPNGAWLVFPSILMIYDMGVEIVEGLSRASPQTVKMD
ncbi:uncharacterized protein B0T15DRAFT_543915 [Chaetomium strumarium]|uniref:C6 transcription factor n=1 Tax=Chaetomium strumarium TaxID=1170767 RepID=A0AAJ0LYV5_9PEZI|nr:hypothetical protein B0T15DRAFT_543915 [Chaetomium strumarium]